MFHTFRKQRKDAEIPEVRMLWEKKLDTSPFCAFYRSVFDVRASATLIIVLDTVADRREPS